MTSEAVTELAGRWNADLQTLSCVSRGGNLVYGFESGGGRFYLRVTASQMRPLELVAAAVDWHRHLHRVGAPVAEPVTSVNGFWIEVIAGDRMPILATVTREVRGKHVDFSSLSELAAWGDTIGRIHEASESYMASAIPTSAGIVRGTLPTLTGLLEQIERVVRGDPDLQVHYDRGLRWLREQSDQTLVTHSDVRPGNALIHDATVTMIDFDEPTDAWPAYDIARMMLDDDARLPLNPGPHLAAILTGYRRARPEIVTGADTVWRFLHVRALLMYAWSLEDGDTDAAWLQRLRAVLEQSVDSSRRDG